MTYGNAHRFFLRTIASQGVLTLADVHKVLEKFTDDGEFNLQDMVKEINAEIRPYKQQIKITNDEVTNEEVVVFLSLGYDDATKAQNIFNATELEYFRVLIEQIMTTESRQITGIHAMNLVGKMKSTFTKTDAQKLLNTWCRMRYLDKEETNYALGVRAIHEFEGYLRENMPDTIEECCLCKQIVFRGYNCPGCSLAVHTRCLKRYLEKVDKWPCCKINFNSDQLDRLNNEGSRLTQTQHIDTTQQSTVYNTVVEPTLHHNSTDDMEVTQEVIPEISQRVTKKRKRHND
ncbi:non-structural maintenance of chromosomes element 1 homolog [Anticarsia gemmatalis]|uniref:non-structural maintenance of chromosomes element 1 homolog n=1 Tax=Anticarsia gemmatalis TaxID=129554 RepID=UPI003F763839